MKRLAVPLFCVLLFPGVLAAQDQPAADKQDRVKALEERVGALEQEISLLKEALKAGRTPTVDLTPAGGDQVALASSVSPAAKAESAPAPDLGAPQAGTAGTAQGGAQVPPQGATPTGGEPQTGAAQLPNYGGTSGTGKALNPDVSVIGDFLGAVGRNPVNRSPSLEMHESELGLQAIIDPYARGDFFLSFGEEGVNLEEGYITFTSLPAGFVAKVGKFRSAFGKVNTLHNHVLPWTDRPLVTQNLVGGEDGIDDAGISITRILPAPGAIFLEGTAQVFRGDSGDVFTATRRGDVSVVGHLRAYRDITESTNIDLGASYARGHNDLGSAFVTDLYGVDATFHWTPLRRVIYHNFVGRAEFILSHRDQLSPSLLPEQQRAFGLYTSGDYRLNRRWTVGGRYDRSERARSAGLIDSGFSGVLTYWPSEFSQIRGQYRFVRYAGGRDANELLFQFQFSLGAHGAHPF
jgi:hypothetical protein